MSVYHLSVPSENHWEDPWKLLGKGSGIHSGQIARRKFNVFRYVLRCITENPNSNTQSFLQLLNQSIHVVQHFKFHCMPVTSQTSIPVARVTHINSLEVKMESAGSSK